MPLCTADQPGSNICLCRRHRNIRHGACGAWKACTRSSPTALRSWSGSMRGRRRRSPSTGATATPTWTPRESFTMWVQERSQTGISSLKWSNTSQPSVKTQMILPRVSGTNRLSSELGMKMIYFCFLSYFKITCCSNIKTTHSSFLLPGNEVGVGRKARGDALAPGNSSSPLSGEPPSQTDCGGEW